MSIELLNIHEHEIIFSYIREADKDSIYKYKMNGWYRKKKNESFMLKENDYIYLQCTTCGYKYESLIKIKAYVTNNIHNLFFMEYYTKNLYTKENQKVRVDNKDFYLADFFLINNDYKGII